jgi:hypothetical protein
MGSRVVRSLVLTCSLLLALPQGWCCLFACHRAKPTTSMPPVSVAAEMKDIPGDAGGGCPLCTNQSAPSSDPTDKRAPADKPSAPCNSICSCADRHATLPATPSVEQVDEAFVLFLLPLAPATLSVGQRAAVDGTDLPPPSLPLHVLNCVWLC